MEDPVEAIGQPRRTAGRHLRARLAKMPPGGGGLSGGDPDLENRSQDRPPLPSELRSFRSSTVEMPIAEERFVCARKYLPAPSASELLPESTFTVMGLHPLGKVNSFNQKDLPATQRSSGNSGGEQDIALAAGRVIKTLNAVDSVER